MCWKQNLKREPGSQEFTFDIFQGHARSKGYTPGGRTQAYLLWTSAFGNIKIEVFEWCNTGVRIRVRQMRHSLLTAKFTGVPSKIHRGHQALCNKNQYYFNAIVETSWRTHINILNKNRLPFVRFTILHCCVMGTVISKQPEVPGPLEYPSLCGFMRIDSWENRLDDVGLYYSYGF